MKYKNITKTKYQIIQHIINNYAEKHKGIKPILSYDVLTEILDIGGISKPINFSTESIGIVPQGAYEVVAQAIRSKDDLGHISDDGMTIYGSATRVYNLVDINRQEVFDFINKNSTSSYCACCGTNRDRNNFFYIRNVDNDHQMYQVGSSCITSHFDTSYFDLLKDISDAIDSDDVILQRKFKDYNLLDYLALYNVFSETANTIAQCNKYVIDVIGSLSVTIDTNLLTKYHQQKSIIAENISAISEFYSAYPDYVKEDKALAIATIQSMHSLVMDDISTDPYYSKTHCMQVVKQYTDVLVTYTADLRKYKCDLFKYNAHLSQNKLIEIWRNKAKSDYQISFSLNKNTLSGKVTSTDHPIVNNLVIDVHLTDTGVFVDNNKAISDMHQFVNNINLLLTARSNWNSSVDELLAYKKECIDRYRHNKPDIMQDTAMESITFFDRIHVPVVIKSDKNGCPICGMDIAKQNIAALVNSSYVCNDLIHAYEKFSIRYFGTPQYACNMPKDINLKFNCEYLNHKYSNSVPNANPKFCAYINTKTSAIWIDYGKSVPLKLYTNTLGILSGADFDIDLKVMTFVNLENGLPAPKRYKLKDQTSEEEKALSRPNKLVKRIFSQFRDVYCANFFSGSNVHIVNNNTGSCGVSSSLGKVLFQLNSGNVVYFDKQNKLFKGKIKIDGYNLAPGNIFDTQTFTRSIHALEYLVKLTVKNQPLYTKSTKVVGNTKSYTYSHTITCGKCKGLLEFVITETEGKYSINQTPRFVFAAKINGVPTLGTMHPTFSPECWKHIQSGILEIDDIKKSHTNNFGSIWLECNKTYVPMNFDVFSYVTGLQLT